jgi:cysteine-rich repeat protein
MQDGSFGEACDEGINNSNDEPDRCRLNCQPARCGDGVQDSGEQCDDGNSVENDTCLNNCQQIVCGDGVVMGTEQCDDGNVESQDGCSNLCQRDSLSITEWFQRLFRAPFSL